MEGYSLFGFVVLLCVAIGIGVALYFRIREVQKEALLSKAVAEQQIRFVQQQAAQSKAADEARIRSLQAVAYIDQMTALFNQFGGDNMLRQAMGVVLRAKIGFFTLIYGDLVRLKQINDTFGHAEGSRAIVLAAEAIKRALRRESDFGIHPHGDEFIIALPHTPPEHAREVMERMCAYVKDVEFFPSEGGRVPIAMSFGGVTLVVDDGRVYLANFSWNLKDRDGSNFVDEVVAALKKGADKEQYKAKEIAHKGPPGVSTISLNAIVPPHQTLPPMTREALFAKP